MPSLLDVLFSVFLGITIVLIIVNANVVVNEGMFTYNSEVLVQQMLISTATLVEGEFRNMGYNVPRELSTNTGIIDSIGVDALSFWSDVDRDGTANLVKYFLGDPEEVAVQNDSIRILYRQVDAEEPRGVGMVTHFRLRFFTREGEELDPAEVAVGSVGNVHLIEIELQVQNPYALYRDPRDIQEGEPDAFYSTSMWRQTRLGSKNFQVRGSL